MSTEKSIKKQKTIVLDKASDDEQAGLNMAESLSKKWQVEDKDRAV